MKNNNEEYRRKRQRPMAEINVVPYIDVMLVLLVIFMITAPLLTQGVKVDLPKAAAQAIATKPKPPIIVSVDAAGNYYLNIARNPSQPVTANYLYSLVNAELVSAPAGAEPRQVLVKGDRHANYEQIVQAMVLLQRAGANSVGLITDLNP
jgi:biopolymer transport protein TolR